MVRGFWENASKRSAQEEELLFDPQTSGGLLLSVPGSQADELVTALKQAGVDAAARIGEVVDDDEGHVRVV
jgi:selenide,water dikinase